MPCSHARNKKTRAEAPAKAIRLASNECLPNGGECGEEKACRGEDMSGLPVYGRRSRFFRNTGFGSSENLKVIKTNARRDSPRHPILNALNAAPLRIEAKKPTNRCWTAHTENQIFVAHLRSINTVFNFCKTRRVTTGCLVGILFSHG